MNINIICVGKLKERFYSDACAEYIKRLSRFGNIEVSEVPDEREPERLSPAEIERVTAAEAQRIAMRIKPGDQIIALCVDGKKYGSEAFSRMLDKRAQCGRICFVIGGSLGIGQSVLARADAQISLSDMTLPHQLARVVLLEQIYRAVKINAGERYHK